MTPPKAPSSNDMPRGRYFRDHVCSVERLLVCTWLFELGGVCAVDVGASDCACAGNDTSPAVSDAPMKALLVARPRGCEHLLAQRRGTREKKRQYPGFGANFRSLDISEVEVSTSPISIGGTRKNHSAPLRASDCARLPKLTLGTWCARVVQLSHRDASRDDVCAHLTRATRYRRQRGGQPQDSALGFRGRGR